MRELANKLTRGLTPAQVTTVLCVLLFTLLGAIALAWVFVRWNGRHGRA